MIINSYFFRYVPYFYLYWQRITLKIKFAFSDILKSFDTEWGKANNQHVMLCGLEGLGSVNKFLQLFFVYICRQTLSTETRARMMWTNNGIPGSFWSCIFRIASWIPNCCNTHFVFYYRPKKPHFMICMCHLQCSFEIKYIKCRQIHFNYLCVI
jgi:hypothetical protein